MTQGGLLRNHDSAGHDPVIRPMGMEDLDRVMAIEQKCFPTPWSRGVFQEMVFLNSPRALVMELEGAIAAYIVFYTAAVEGHVMNLAVDPDKRREHFATRLLSRTLQLFRETGIEECYLEVRESNLAAQELYKSFGFETIGRRRKYYAETGEDALVMRFFL